MSTTRPVPSSFARTVVLENPWTSAQQPPQTLRLQLRRKKKVAWKEGTVDNGFMQKKSSKKCCIFHKDKSFDEDDSDEEDPDHHHHHHHESDGCDGDSTSN